MTKIINLGSSNFSLPSGWNHEEITPNHMKCVHLEGLAVDLFSVITKDLNEYDIETLSKECLVKVLGTSSTLPDIVRKTECSPNSWVWKNQTDMTMLNSPDNLILVRFRESFDGHVFISMVQVKQNDLEKWSSHLDIIQSSWYPSDSKEININPDSLKSWSSSMSTELDCFCQKAMKDFQITGMVVSVIDKQGENLYKKAFGNKKLGEDSPVTTETMFRIGSTTKALISLMISVLASQGKISWDTRIQEIFPAFKLKDDRDGMASKLTLKHCFSASTGLPRRDAELIFRPKETPEYRMTELEEMTPTSGFGEIFQYSNHLVALGGYAAARAVQPENLSLEKALEKTMNEIFGPLGMSGVTPRIEEDCSLDFAYPHALDLSNACTPLSLDEDNFTIPVVPTGGLWANASILENYLLLELNEGNFGGEQLVSRELLLARRESQIPIDFQSDYCLGLFHHNWYGLEWWGHGGNTLGFSASADFVPSLGTGVAILANAPMLPFVTAAITAKILELRIGWDSKKWASRSNLMIDKNKGILQNLRAPLKSVSMDSAKLHAILSEVLGKTFENPMLGKLIFDKDQANIDSFYVCVGDMKSQLGLMGERQLVMVHPTLTNFLSTLTLNENSMTVLLTFAGKGYEFTVSK